MVAMAIFEQPLYSPAERGVMYNMHMLKRTHSEYQIILSQQFLLLLLWPQWFWKERNVFRHFIVVIVNYDCTVSQFFLVLCQWIGRDVHNTQHLSNKGKLITLKTKSLIPYIYIFLFNFVLWRLREWVRVIFSTRPKFTWNLLRQYILKLTVEEKMPKAGSACCY